MNSINKKIIKSDFCVIGAGSGGLTFAAGAVQMGASVVLIEHNKMGGDCLNYGCVPSKALIAAAKISHSVKESSKFGWTINKMELDYKVVHQHIHSVIGNIAPNDSIERFEKLGVKVILEEAKFIDDSTVETTDYIIKAKRFIIATGSKPFIPPIKGLSDVKYYTNETIFDLKQLPKNLVIIGGGPIGIEMAQAFYRLGSNVTLLDVSNILPNDDQQIVEKLKIILIDEGIKILENIKILKIEKAVSNINLIYTNLNEENFTIEASHVLVAAGRRPNINNLSFDVANIKASPKGIIVDKHLRTSNKRVYAIGDCNGGYQFTHSAGYQAGIAIRNTIFKLNAKIETRAIPWVTYTDPELAHIGLKESQLINEKIDYKLLSATFDENDRAQTEKRTQGEIKVLVTPKGNVLGVTILGDRAGELIFPWVILVQNKLKISTITSSIAPYPTLNEISKRVAGNFYKDKIFNQFTKKIVKILMKFTI